MAAKTAPTIAFDVHEKRIQVGAHEITIQTGKVARQAGGSVMIRMRDTVALVTACAGAAKDVDFIPLTLDYQEKSYASGRIPGSFFRREGRPGVHEILRSRIIDRSLRPLFPDGWNYETQIVPTVVSSDPDVDPGILCLTGASFALMLSDIAFDTPVAGVRVGRVDGEYIANPTAAELEKSDVDIAVACSRDAIVMVEGGANFVEESVIVDALLFAHKSVQPLIDAMFEWREKIGKPRLPYNPPEKNAALEKRVAALCEKGLSEATLIAEKQARYEKYATTKAAMLEGLGEEFADKTALAASYFEALKSRIMRERIVKDHRRIDGRGPADVRPISIEVGVLPRTHGSALFTRGETQSLVVVTLGTREDEQKIETLDGTTFKRFLLHYNFPPFSVGEVKRMGSPGRREIGHGALAERAVERIVPADTEFPYTMRVVSEITESNGSSSMATVCGASLAMYDAGVPTLSPVAGVAMGLIKEGSDIAILTDILGDEDHLGDMDFKVCGNDKGVSALQMDIKIAGVDREVLTRALSQARDARLHILSCMNEAISGPREEMSPFAPRITVFYIKPDRIRDVIGPGGKIIRDLVARTGCAINLEDDGKVSIASSDQAKAAMARKLIEDLTQEAEVGQTYLGTVVKTTDFGAFVEILPGIEGLCHISELAPKRIERVTDIVQEGDEIVVKVLGIDRQGKIRLSRKEALADQQGAQD